MSLSGRRVLITGGGTGVGASMARGFSAAGAEVILCGRRSAPLEAVAKDLPRARVLVADVTDASDVATLYQNSGEIDIVIANAGSARSAPFHRTSLDLWREMLDVNLTGAFLTLRDGYAQMRGRQWGRLIAISSIAGLRGSAYVSAYTASKHGVIGLVRAIAAETDGSGITANALCPGYLDTGMTDRTLEAIVARTGRTRAEALCALTVHNSHGRLIHPDEVTAHAVRLCQPGAEATNGAAIEIDGSDG